MAVRPTMQVRVAPADLAKLKERGQTEGRSIGEVIGLVLRENELAFSSRRSQDRGEAKKA